jgi:uncharacterized protein
MSLAPRTRVELLYEGTDISRDIAADLLSFTYTDNEHGKADDMSLRLKNNHGLWSGAWLPRKGDTISATIVHLFADEEKRLPCGRFSIDDIDFSGPPSVVDIKGVSVPLDTTIRRLQRSRGWEDTKLSDIASEIAATGGIQLQFLVDFDPTYGRVDQHEESDLRFLQRLCEQEAYSLKVTDRQLVVFSSELQEQAPPIRTIEVGKDWVKSWRFNTQAHDVYQTIIVAYKDTETGEVNEFTYTDPAISDGRTSKLVKRAESIEEAERRAKAAMRRHNRLESTGSITIKGDTELVTGVTIEYISGSAFDGKFLVTKATHKVGSGYEVELDLAFVKEGDS